MNENVTAYPLCWPRGKERTPAHRRTRANFSRRESETRYYGDGTSYKHSQKKFLTTADSLKRLQGELERLGARQVVISTMVELRQDGLPYSNRRTPDDPGVAVYFKLDGDPVALAVDKYSTIADNMAAIAAHVYASRAIERYGVGTLREIFRGYTALPAAMAMVDWRFELDNPQTLEEAEHTYRMTMKDTHPDVPGGDTAAAITMNEAIRLARAHFGAA